MTNAFIVLQMNTLVQKKYAFYAIVQNIFFLLYYGDDHFSAGDEHVESAHSNFWPMPLHM